MHLTFAFSLSCLPLMALGMLDLRRTSFEALVGIDKRQTQICGSVPVGTPNPCAAACGPGNQICISLPTCFNPTVGETCCVDGSYCPEGYYCTDAGCCPNGLSVEECGATQVIATVPGIDNPSSSTPSSTATSTIPETTTLLSSSFSSTSTSSSSSSTPSPSPAPSYTSPQATPPVVTSSTNTTSYASPSQTIPVYTGGVAQDKAAGWGVGVLAVLGLGIMV